MRAIAIIFFIWLGLSAWYVVDSVGMERGIILQAPMLKGDITIRTLAGYLSIYHSADPLLRRATSFDVKPFSWKADHDWGGGFYFHFGRKHHPSHGSEYSEIRMPLIVPLISLPLLLAIAGYFHHRTSRKRQVEQCSALDGDAPSVLILASIPSLDALKRSAKMKMLMAATLIFVGSLWVYYATYNAKIMRNRALSDAWQLQADLNRWGSDKVSSSDLKGLALLVARERADRNFRGMIKEIAISSAPPLWPGLASIFVGILGALSMIRGNPNRNAE